MRNKIKFLLIVLTLFIGISNVNAYSSDSKFTRTHHFIGTPQLKYGEEGNYNKTFNPGYMYVTNKANGSEQYLAYCIDPQLNSSVNLVTHRLLMQSDEEITSEDYGILTIIKNGDWKYNGSLPTNNAERSTYDATSFALRGYINAILGWKHDTAENSSVKYIISQVYNWVKNDKQMTEDYKTLTGNDPRFIVDNYHISDKYGFVSYGNYGSLILENAERYIKNGLHAAAEHKKGNVTEPKVSVMVEGTVDLEQTTSGKNTTYKRLVVVSFETKNFTITGSNIGYVNYKGFSGIGKNTTVQELGYSYSYSDNVSDYMNNGQFSKSANIPIELANKKADKLYIGYLVTTTTSDDSCDTSFKVDYTYKDPNILNGAILYANEKNANRYQRFVIYSNDELNNSITVKPASCNNSCEPEINVPQICTDGTKPDANNNVTYTYKEGFNNIKKCVVDKTDAAGNGYTLKDGDYAKIVETNPYCSISCKEDYKFTMPYKITTENGRYFKLGMDIEGQQDCYSSEINTSKFNEDIIKTQKEIVDYYNEWMKYYELVNNSLISTGSTDNCWRTRCSGGKDDCSESTSISKTVNIHKIEFKGTYYSYRESGNTLLVNADSSKRPSTEYYGYVEENDSGYCSDSCSRKGYTCKAKTHTEDYNSKKSGYQSNLKDYQQKLLNSIEKLKQIVDEYNGCMADKSYKGYSNKYDNAYWDMIYSFNPDIKYSYDEPDPTSPGLSKWINTVKGLTCDDKTCDTLIGYNEKVYAEKCAKGDKNCTEVNKVTTIFDKKVKNTTEYCKSGNLNENTYECYNTQTNVTYDVKSFFNCDFSGGKFNCSQHRYNVTDLAYIHKVATASGTYDTARVYYSRHDSGNIVIKSTNDNRPKNSDRVKGLPVATTTPQGTYFYTLSLNNIGKYYSTNELGRIFGTKSTSLSSTLRDDRITTINGDSVASNAYACTYTVSQNTCTDSDGIEHDLTAECAIGEDRNTCKKRVCPVGPKNYCVKEAQSYYVCDNEYYDAKSCVKKDSRSEALAESEENYNCCPNCQVMCVGKCIFDFDEDRKKGDVLLDFRTITPSNVNPNSVYGRGLGYNWDINNKSNVLVAQKAQNTITEIEARANVNVESGENKNLQDYTFKVKLTPNMVTWVKNYNKQNESNGSYNNDTLNCYDYTLTEYNEKTCEQAGYTWENNSCKMTNIFCYSTFIDELIENFPDEVDAKNRQIAKDDAKTNYSVYTNSQLPNNETKIITNDYFTIYEYTNLDINGDGIPDIGPSWK